MYFGTELSPIHRIRQLLVVWHHVHWQNMRSLRQNPDLTSFSGGRQRLAQNGGLTTHHGRERIILCCYCRVNVRPASDPAQALPPAEYRRSGKMPACQCQCAVRLAQDGSLRTHHGRERHQPLLLQPSECLAVSYPAQGRHQFTEFVNCLWCGIMYTGKTCGHCGKILI